MNGEDDTCKTEKTMLPGLPIDPDFRRLNLALKWMKEERTGERKGKRDRTRRGGLRERHKNTRTHG